MAGQDRLRTIRRALVTVVAALLVSAGPLWWSPALAQSEPEVSAHASSRQVEVGEPFTVELKALAEGGAQVTSPELRVPPEFTARGPQLSTQTYAQLGRGGAVMKSGIGATWELVASKPGHYVIPSPSVSAGGKKLTAKPIPIDVVPATGAPHGPRGSSPFLLPGGPKLPWPFGAGRSPFDQLDDDTPDSLPDSVSELSMDRAPDDKIFLRAVPDKTSAVVGEQISVSFYVYTRVDVNVVENHDAKLADFLRVPLVKDPGADKTQFATAGGKRFAVKLIDKIALFPLKSGELHTGSMNVRFSGRRLGANVPRESNDLVFHVTEPPVDGRPAGYALGDVGAFSMTAEVEPRKTEQGGTVAVTVRVTGSGNLPQSLRAPARTGIEWLDPEKRESIEPQNGIVQGWRSFAYVVRLQQSGHVDLGAIELPFWDPAKKHYEVARAELGAIDVAPSKAPPPAASAEADQQRDAFPTLPGARKELHAYAVAKPPPFEGRSFWLLLAMPPVAVAFAGAASRGVGWARTKRVATRAAPDALAARALKELDAAAAQGDAKALSAAAERAVYHAVEAATGLKGRGVLLGELASELTARGVAPELAEGAREVLAACDAIRFQPEAAGDLGDLATHARAVCRELMQ